MKQTICSLFIGFSALTISLAVPQGADAYVHCTYESECYFYDAEEPSFAYDEYYYASASTDVESTATYDGFCDEYNDGADCYHYVYERDYVYDRDVYATHTESNAIQLSFPTYTQTTPTSYSYPVYTPVYVPTPVTQTVHVPVTKTVAKTVYVPSKKKKKSGFTVTYSQGY